MKAQSLQPEFVTRIESTLASSAVLLATARKLIASRHWFDGDNDKLLRSTDRWKPNNKMSAPADDSAEREH